MDKRVRHGGRDGRSIEGGRWGFPCWHRGPCWEAGVAGGAAGVSGQWSLGRCNTRAVMEVSARTAIDVPRDCMTWKGRRNHTQVLRCTVPCKLHASLHTRDGHRWRLVRGHGYVCAYVCVFLFLCVFVCVW